MRRSVTSSVSLHRSQEVSLCQPVGAGDGVVEALGFEISRGAAHEAGFVNRAGVLALGVQAAAVQVDFLQTALQEAADRFGVAREVQAVGAGVECGRHGVGPPVSSTHFMSECDGVMLPGIQAVFSFIRY